MYEKVNPAHPDKIADRIGGALVDMAYGIEDDPRIAVEVLIGHGRCNIITETSVELSLADVSEAVWRIAGDRDINVKFRQYKQDEQLARNQAVKLRCGDNGIFRCVPVTAEQKRLAALAHRLYDEFDADGKYILDDAQKKLIICQSNALPPEIRALLREYGDYTVAINPLGFWTGGINVDSGATNRKLGSDMGDSVTGGGIAGKDYSKADVSINIYGWLKAQESGEPFETCCAIGDDFVDGKPYSEIVDVARQYIESRGGFEKFAEWGLIV